MNLQPSLDSNDYVFCHFKDRAYGDLRELQPIGSFMETEGLTLILERASADKHGIQYSSVFRRITLEIHSSLLDVGLTRQVSTILAERGISANVVAAFFHDHLFVPRERAEEALAALSEFGK